MKFTKLHASVSFGNFTGSAVVAIWAFWQLILFTRLATLLRIRTKIRNCSGGASENCQYALRIAVRPRPFALWGWRCLFTLYGNPSVKEVIWIMYMRDGFILNLKKIRKE